MDKKYQLPVNWRASKLSDIAKVSGGKRLPKGTKLIEENTGHPYIRVLNMKETGISTKDLLYVPESAVDPIKKYRIYSGELYISVAGTLGLVGDVPKELDGANLTENANRISDIECDPRYLLYVLRSNLIQKYIRREKTISAQPKLALTRIRNFDIPLPPKYEQQKVASILSSVDEAIKMTGNIIQQLEMIKEGIIQKLFTRSLSNTEYRDSQIGEVPSHWEIIKIKDISKKITKGSTPTTYGFEYTDEGINFIKVESIDDNGNFKPELFNKISEEAFETFERSQIQEDDLLMSIAGNLGRVVIATEDIVPANTNQAISIIRIDTDVLDVKFLYYYLKGLAIKSYIRKVSTIGAQPNLSLKQVGEIEVPKPKMDEQREIVEILKNLDDKINIEVEKKNNLNSIKQGLMQQLLTGKVRVPLNENEEVPQ